MIVRIHQLLERYCVRCVGKSVKGKPINEYLFKLASKLEFWLRYRRR